MGLLLLIVLILVVFGSAPAWPYSRGWGYAPSGVAGLVLLIVLVLLLMNIMPWGFYGPGPHPL
jgi:hypothetical protein